MESHQSAYLAQQDDLLIPVPERGRSGCDRIMRGNYLGPWKPKRIRPFGARAVRKVGAHEAFLSDDPNLKQKLEDTLERSGGHLQWEAYRLWVALGRYAGRVSILRFPGRFQPKPDFDPLDPEWF